jgi:hypothetical protein
VPFLAKHLYSLGKQHVMTVGDLIAARINEISFLLSLGVSAWFFRQFRRLELQQKHEELLDQLLSGK